MALSDIHLTILSGSLLHLLILGTERYIVFSELGWLLIYVKALVFVRNTLGCFHIIPVRIFSEQKLFIVHKFSSEFRS